MATTAMAGQGTMFRTATMTNATQARTLRNRELCLRKQWAGGLRQNRDVACGPIGADDLAGLGYVEAQLTGDKVDATGIAELRFGEA